MQMRTLWLSMLLMAGMVTLAQERLVLATTTSTENSGLLDTLIPAFEARFALEVDVIAVGTGAALKLGANGDADVLLVHAPEAEKLLVESGDAVNRRYVMYNDFVILGPEHDPAQIAEGEAAAEVLKKIADAEVPFLSRGDDSGTHKKERSLWALAEVEPAWGSYQEVGQGMGATLIIAQEQQGYAMSDRGTYLAIRAKLDALTLLYAGDEVLFNPYHVMAVSPRKHPTVNYFGAMQFIAYLTSPEVQAEIAAFTIEGEKLFFPAAHTVPFD